MQNMQRIMGGMSESERTQYVGNAERDSLRRGEDLFKSTTLGTNGQACASCHPRGGTTGGQQEMMPGMRMPIPDLHRVARTFPKFKVPNDAVITLAEMNNNCLVMFQRGTPLVLNSREARDLAAYVSSLE
jgi:cytochrome c